MKRRGGGTRNEYNQDYKKIMLQFSVLDVALWPTEMPPGFGEDEVKKLPSRLILNVFRDVVDDFGRKLPDDFQPLVKCTKVIPCGTAECEQGFSHINIIITDICNKLLLSYVSSLMFIKLHVPPLSCWKQTNYVC